MHFSNFAAVIENYQGLEMHKRGRLCLRRSLSFTFVLCCLFSYTWVSAQESKLAEVAKLFANIEERDAYVETLEPDFMVVSEKVCKLLFAS